jgi:ATP-dependent Clp protease ATP-binding subunit ClpC
VWCSSTRSRRLTPDIFNSLLQILDEGRLTDAQGRVVDFKNTVIVMTTNLGTRDIAKSVSLGFSGSSGTEGGYDKMKAKVTDELKQHFRPEFLNRVDEIVVFRQLSQEDIERIVDLMVAQIEIRLKDKDMGIELTPAAKTLIAKRASIPCSELVRCAARSSATSRICSPRRSCSWS